MTDMELMADKLVRISDYDFYEAISVILALIELEYSIYEIDQIVNKLLMEI